MKNNIVTLLILLASFLVSPLCANARSVKSMNKFYEVLGKNKFVLAYCYWQDKETNKNKEVVHDLKELDRMVDSLSKLYPYKKGDLRFVKVNLAKGNLDSLVQDQSIPVWPAFILFKNGRRVTNLDEDRLQRQVGSSTQETVTLTEKEGDLSLTEQFKMTPQQPVGKPVILTGFVTGEQLKAFIDKYLTDDLEDYRQDKEDEREFRRRQRRYYWSVGWPYYGSYWGGPYWGYGPRYYRPGVSIGFGFGY